MEMTQGMLWPVRKISRKKKKETKSAKKKRNDYTGTLKICSLVKENFSNKESSEMVPLIQNFHEDEKLNLA